MAPMVFFVEAKMEAAGCVSLSDGWKVDPYSVHAARMSSVEVLVGVGWVGMIVRVECRSVENLKHLLTHSLSVEWLAQTFPI